MNDLYNLHTSHQQIFGSHFTLPSQYCDGVDLTQFEHFSLFFLIYNMHDKFILLELSYKYFVQMLSTYLCDKNSYMKFKLVNFTFFFFKYVEIVNEVKQKPSCQLGNKWKLFIIYQFSRKMNIIFDILPNVARCRYSVNIQEYKPPPHISLSLCFYIQFV